MINESGIAFSGHTEFLAKLTHTEQVVMMLATRGLRVALVTTHLPLRDVADAITAERVAARHAHPARRPAAKIRHRSTGVSWSVGDPHGR